MVKGDNETLSVPR